MRHATRTTGAREGLTRDKVASLISERAPDANRAYCLKDSATIASRRSVEVASTRMEPWMRRLGQARKPRPAAAPASGSHSSRRRKISEISNGPVRSHLERR